MSAPKLAALVYSSYSVPGDERSRTNPGHGYPAHDVETISLQEFASLAEMEKWVTQHTTGLYAGSHKKFKLIKYEELTYTTEVKVNVSPR